MFSLSNEGVGIRWPLNPPAVLIFYDLVSQRHVNKPSGRFTLFSSQLNAETEIWGLSQHGYNSRNIKLML